MKKLFYKILDSVTNWFIGKPSPDMIRTAQISGELQSLADIEQESFTRELLEVLKECEAAMSTANEHCYSDGAVHHQSFDTLAIGNAIIKARVLIAKSKRQPL